MSDNREFWDVGENCEIHPTQKFLAQLMSAILLCGAKVHSSGSPDIAENHVWRQSSTACCFTIRISLPHGMRNRFEELTGIALSVPNKVHT